MRNNMIKIIENAPKHLAVISYADVFPRCDEVNAEFADYLIASIRKLDAEQEAGLTIRNLQLESELKQLRDKIAESAPQWIPVFKPPKEDGSHLVYDYIGGVSVAHYWAQGDTWTDTFGFGLHPMYWNTMLLPEPPRENVNDILCRDSKTNSCGKS